MTGTGGVGKTRLALEVGAEVAGEFADGVWIVELAGVDDSGVIPALATVLGITPQGDVPLIDTIADALAGRRLLLVVDNCEHVVRAAAGAVEAILGRAGNVRIVATSREGLGVTAESITTVSPLSLAGGASSEAVTLFLDRARAVRPNLEIQDPQTAAAVTEICETVDGLPLGIELAAARMAAMSAVEVRDRLADRFRLLQGGAAAPERQLTLRHAVEWSYDLLTDDERSLLRRASVFAGGFELTSMCAVVDDADEIDVLRHLDSLVRKSLVVADHSATRTRYGLFETIRQFGEDRLAEAGEHEPARDLHATYFAHQASAQWERWNGPGWRQAVDWLELELANLRSGFRWSSERGRGGGGDRHRRPRRADGLLGAAVRDPRLGRAAPRCRVGRRRPPTSSALHGGRLRLLRRSARRCPQERSPGHRVGGRRSLRPAASRATRCSSRRSARCTAAISIATSSSPARSPAATAPTAATGWRRTSTVSNRRDGSRRHWH